MSRSGKIIGSRRRFLQTTVGVGAGFANWPIGAYGMEEAVSPHAPGQPLDLLKSARDDQREQDFCGIPDRSEVVGAVARGLQSIMAEGVDWNFPKPFELERLQRGADLRRRVAEMAVDHLVSAPGDLIGPLHTMVVPKTSMFGYRRCAHPDLIGAVRYLSCVIMIGKRLEPIRIPVSAQKVFSYRFKVQGNQIFDDFC